MNIVQDGIVYEKIIGSDQYRVVAGAATNGKIIIPQTINGHMVTEIAIEAFKEQDSVIDVQIPDSLVIIGPYAFYHCKNLNCVVIYMTRATSKKIEISRFAFAKCTQLIAFTSTSPLILYEYAFYDCKMLTRLNATVSYCSNGTFKNCRLLSQIAFDDSAHWVHASFSNCDGLRTIIFNGGISKSTLKSRSSMNALYDKSIVCNANFPHLDLVCQGFKIKIV